ncbi:erythromycin esterase family protein [Streptomyces piniterrae]|uniref:Erythromycin esterase family protein n=1 Tax=Streptomyces piniterrae TaxID=2571125 RepID=A0A4U0NXC8_9ACTN|nr:erythromycin esterase family protein [Streptomyces piniterrae]TJZ58822.1 erythromycin esterase family protein [Streptomyces piniterrae]
MTKEIRDFATTSCDLLALGEPTHREPAFGWVRNELFVQLVDRGFRSIALETDRVAALTVNDFVQEGVGSLDAVMSEGFSHGFGELEANRRLIAWMREHNESRPPAERLAFHGFDAATETMSAPSPRSYLEYARDYLKLDLDLASLTGDDERWSRTEAIMDPAMSIGDTAEAQRLRALADDMLTSLHARAPELIAATSRAEWFRARAHLTAGLGLLRYHKQSAQRLEQGVRWTHMCATRDALMAQNLLDIRDMEARRGATLVFAHNLHLQRNPSSMRMGDMELDWFGAGAILGSLVGEEYTFVAGSLGRSEALGLQEPEPDTYEGLLQRRISTWGLTTATTVVTTATTAAATRTRTDTTPQQGYFPLDEATLDEADAVLHINTGTAAGVAPAAR